MLEPIQGRIDLLAAEFTEAITNSDNTSNAGCYWQQLFTNFLRQVIYYHTAADKPYDPHNLETAHPFVYCFAGPVVRGIGSPLSTIDAFVVLKDEKNDADAKRLADRINVAMERIDEELLAISQKTNMDYLRPSSVKITPTVFCGTAEQLIKKMSVMNTDSCINAIFTAIPLIGNCQLLKDLQDKLIMSPVRSTYIYANPISFFYGIAVVEFNGAVNRETINLKNDIMRPVLAILDGLRLEFNAGPVVDPKATIEALLNNKNISADAARLFTLILNRIGQLRWYLDMHHIKTQELIPIEFENINEIIQIVALLRGEANKRIKKDGNKISLNEKRPATFAIDKANAAYLDRIFNKDNDAFDLYVATDIIPLQIRGELSKINRNITKANTAAGVASRIFNEIEHLNHHTTFIESFFRCVEGGVLNKDKFTQWMNMVISRCIYDLFDVEGNLKKTIIELINKDRIYDRIVEEGGKEKVNKEILFSYFMNPLFYDTILIDPRYVNLSGSMNSNKPSISRATQQYANEYFERNIKTPNITIKEIHNANCCNSLLRIYPLLERLIKQFQNALNHNLEKREIELYVNCLGKDTDHHSLLGILKSLDDYFETNGRNFVSTDVFHDYRDRIYQCLTDFIAKSKPLKLEQDRPKGFWTSVFATDQLLKHIQSDVYITQIYLDAVSAELIVLQPEIKKVSALVKR